MADVFISYNAESAGEKSAEKLVPSIAASLEKVGITCWYAERDMLPGSFGGEIAEKIDDCQIFLLILNKKSLKSAHVKNEVHLAFQRISHDETITPVYFQVDDCSLSDDNDMRYYLSRFQLTNGNPPDQKHIQGLVEQIAGLIRNGLPTWTMVYGLEQQVKKLTQIRLKYRLLLKAATVVMWAGLCSIGAEVLEGLEKELQALFAYLLEGTWTERSLEEWNEKAEEFSAQIKDMSEKISAQKAELNQMLSQIQPETSLEEASEMMDELDDVPESMYTERMKKLKNFEEWLDKMIECVPSEELHSLDLDEILDWADK